MFLIGEERGEVGERDESGEKGGGGREREREERGRGNVRD